MKSLMTFLFLATLNASAADLTCHVPGDQPNLTDTYDVNISGDQFEISHYGHSRNTYSAVYQLSDVHPTRVGSMGTLIKIQDNSTWKDMPEKLYERYFAGGGFTPGYWIEGLEENTVVVDLSSCQQKSINDCPPGRHPGHCPSRNCGTCTS